MKKIKKPQAASVSSFRRVLRRCSAISLFIVVALNLLGIWYVHHPAAWLAARQSAFTRPLVYFGDRASFLTDAAGWTGEDCLVSTTRAAPTNQVFFAGAPKRIADPAPTDLVILNRDAFVVGYSPTLRHPAWVAYHVPREARFESTKRPNFTKDRNVPSSPKPGDYTNTGYDRGHMAPNRALVTRFGPEIQKKTFNMTNIAPQRPALNRGPWRELEQRIADLWTHRYGEIWVIVGTLSSSRPRSRERLSGTTIDVPSAYWMLIAAQTDEGVRTLAVVLPQTADRWTFPVHNIVTIDELEAWTGYDFFPDLPQSLLKPLETGRPTRLWPIHWQDFLTLILIRFA